MVFRISISISRFSTDARLRLLLLTHLMATTSRVSLCRGEPTLDPPPPQTATLGVLPQPARGVPDGEGRGGGEGAPWARGRQGTGPRLGAAGPTEGL